MGLRVARNNYNMKMLPAYRNTLQPVARSTPHLASEASVALCGAAPNPGEQKVNPLRTFGGSTLENSGLSALVPVMDWKE